jgi:zinc protease
MMKEKGPFLISMQTRASETEKALQLTHQTLNNFLTKGPQQNEVEAAKQNLIGSFPFQLASNDAIAAGVNYIAFYGLPLDYFSTYQKNISKVDRKQIQSAFTKHVNPSKLLTIIVGSK